MDLTTEKVQKFCHQWLTVQFNGVYANPKAITVVPFTFSNVFVRAFELDYEPGRFVVSFRSPILMCIPPSADFDEFKLSRPRPDIVHYYFYEDDGLHVDFMYESRESWLDEDTTCEIVRLLGRHADDFGPKFQDAFGGVLPREEWSR